MFDYSQTEHCTGIIQEKAKFPMIRGPNGEVQREAFSRYFIRLQDSTQESLVDGKHVRRDRKVFTKQNLRAFLKHSLQRETWIGAPWLVKEHLAIHYRLPMEIPAHLLQDAQLLANKVPETESCECHFRMVADRLQQQMLQVKQPRKRTKNFSQDELNRQQHEELMRRQMQQVSTTPDGQLRSVSDTLQQPGAQLHDPQHPHNNRIAIPTVPKVVPPPPPKYPMEDLDLPPKHNKVTRPELQFFTPEMSRYVLDGRKTSIDGIEMSSMGMLLEVWNTLNVQAEVYVLDSFVFDDFVDAMNYHAPEPPCELLNEVHCAVLKLLVDDKGKLTLSKGALPEMVVESEDESEEEAMDESEMSTPLPDAPARSTRSRLSHMEVPVSPSLGPEKTNRASEMLADRDWITRLAARDFEDGGWQVILVGVLHQLSQSPVYKTRCDQVLAWLAPIDDDATRETARSQYTAMDVNLRISALQMITILSIATPDVKTFLEACSDDMTDVRKRKIEFQRLRKAAIEELQVKDRERRILLPDNMAPDSPEEDNLDPAGNSDTDDVVEVHMANSSDAEDEAPINGRSLRRGNDRKRKREEEAARAAEEKKKKAELAKQHPKQSKEFKKLLVEIAELNKQILDHEEKIRECDNDLREANVQRTKVLGKDRYCNRYYWFERNGQPFGGLPRSTTAHYGYANGRLWVQGPDDMEREGFIDRDPEEQKRYKQQFGQTVSERRSEEEGRTSLQSAQEWGFYDDKDRLDNLIAWLDERGEREKKLRRELVEWRDTIAQYMEAHKKFKDEEAARKLEAEEEGASTSRISTRHKVAEEQWGERERCLKWRNSMAVEQIGHPHSEVAVARRPTKQRVQLRQKGVAVPVNRLGKPVTRQGV